jgi:hypothetical protein
MYRAEQWFAGRRFRWQAAITIMALAQLMGGYARAADDQEAIRQLLLDTFDRPEARLVVDPLVVAGDHAVADWIQDQRGGRALLHRRAGAWRVVLCSGDGITTAQGLHQAGVPLAEADLLSSKLAEAEGVIAPDRRALFSTFEGTVLIEAGSHHGGPPAHRANQ